MAGCCLGDTRHAMRELAQAREVWQQALAILKDLQHPGADEVGAKLASANDGAASLGWMGRRPEKNGVNGPSTASTGSRPRQFLRC
jgi:hypothetical protein